MRHEEKCGIYSRLNHMFTSRFSPPCGEVLHCSRLVLGFSREKMGCYQGLFTPKSELPLPSSDSVLPRPVPVSSPLVARRTNLFLAGLFLNKPSSEKPFFKILHIPDLGGDCCPSSMIITNKYLLGVHYWGGRH